MGGLEPYVCLKNVSIDIPVISPVARRFVRKPNWSHRASTGGGIQSSNNILYIKALLDINIELKKGDKLALLGGNGAGKSTLLRVISEIYPITKGIRKVVGSKSIIFDVTNGFSTELTGLETIKHYHRLFLNKQSFSEVLNDIVDLSGLGEYLDLPVRIYSSGMKTRLYASLAIEQQSDITIIDEGIGAADAAFQSKYYEKLESFIDNSGILIFASHSAELCKKYCNLGLVLEKGQQKFYGSLSDALVNAGM